MKLAQAEYAANTPLKALATLGQSVWLDYISRDILQTGELRRLIEEDGIRGLTSNPVIFEKAITTTDTYDASLRRRLEEGDADVAALVELLTVADIRAAADLFRPTYQATHGRDGYVSLEVSPRLAWDEERTISEALRLWHLVERPNLMVKVPGTPAGVRALRRLIGSGVNVNVTLLFSVETYDSVIDGYVAGIQDLIASGGDAAKVASVASFFVSRIDSALDAVIEVRLAQAGAQKRRYLETLLGTIAIANARLAYAHFEARFAERRWTDLAARAGVHPQRLLWASTGTKNPNYSDVLYVEALVGPQTINTMPPATMDAFRAHGKARPTLLEGLDDARATLELVRSLELPLDATIERLLHEGIALFMEAEEKLERAVATKREVMLA